MNNRPTANQLLEYPFVVANGASAEAIAAGAQGLLDVDLLAEPRIRRCR